MTGSAGLVLVRLWHCCREARALLVDRMAQGRVRVGVVFLVLVTAVAALVAYPGVIDDLGDEASANDRLSFAGP